MVNGQGFVKEGREGMALRGGAGRRRSLWLHNGPSLPEFQGRLVAQNSTGTVHQTIPHAPQRLLPHSPQNKETSFLISNPPCWFCEGPETAGNDV